MTEKRFVPDEHGFVYDIEAKGYVSDIFELLNELCDENKKLKSLCKVLIKHIEKNSIAFVIDENVRRFLE